MLNALGITFGGIGQQGGYRLGNFIAQKAFVKLLPGEPPLISPELRRSIGERFLLPTGREERSPRRDRPRSDTIPKDQVSVGARAPSPRTRRAPSEQECSS
jgi:hypothetical protein